MIVQDTLKGVGNLVDKIREASEIHVCKTLAAKAQKCKDNDNDNETYNDGVGLYGATIHIKLVNSKCSLNRQKTAH